MTAPAGRHYDADMETLEYLTRFRAEHPGAYLLDPGDRESLTRYLRSQRWIGDDEVLTAVEKAGEGNMNLAVRVITGHRRLILKQGRPWVEKYPHIPAPWERTPIEGHFYRVVARVPEVARRMPRCLGLDETSHILALEDIVGGRDMTGVYRGESMSEKVQDALVDWVGALHRIDLTDGEWTIFQNRAMRQLNHEHIFRFPLDPANGLDLERVTPGLAVEAARLQRHQSYRDRVEELGRLYLSDGSALVHGDYFPGSWLLGSDGVRVIDPEFAFVGAREFDLGVMAAHLMFAGAGATAPAELAARFDDPDAGVVRGFAGVELMRRLIGVAQLPLSADLASKRRLLQLSERLVLEG